MKPDICIYHSPCADGFTAAWVVRKRFGEDVEFVPGVYGHEPPDVTGKHVLLVDFSYKRPVLEPMARSAKSLTILDHHKTAQEDLKTFADDMSFNACSVEVLFDMERSGAQITWDFLFPGERRQPLVNYVGDRDLWRFKLIWSREVAAFVFSYPYAFKAWDFINARMQDAKGLQNVAEEGGAIERKHHKDIAELLAQTKRRMVIGGVEVPVANLPYTMASDAAGKMAENAPFAACYFDRPDARVFSLRSRGDGMDVADIAAKYGGGGHKNAAGFQKPIGWEGDA